MVFFLELLDTITQEAISYFQVQITHAVKYMDHFYYCYNQFVDLVKLNLIFDNKPILIAAFEINLLYCCNLDICGCSKTFNFYYNYWNQISRGRKPNFGIFNKMPQLYYQHYPNMLEDLTSAKKAVIV